VVDRDVTWVYFSTRTRAGEADTLRLILDRHVVGRSARNSTGYLIARVGDLRPGDRLLLVFSTGKPYLVRAAGGS
jgi:hypothetical protein